MQPLPAMVRAFFMPLSTLTTGDNLIHLNLHIFEPTFPNPISSIPQFMKKIFALLSIYCLSLGFIQAQKKAKDYILTNTNDTIYGTVRPGTPAQRSLRIGFTAENSKDAQRYEPFQIKAYYLAGEKATYESQLYQVAGLEYAYAVYMQRMNDGYIRVYEYWNTEGERGFIQTFLQRSDERLVEVNFQRFKKQMVLFFDDFPQLADKIERGAFGKNDLTQIVSEYNIWKSRGW
jgi:hypothetical protein